MHIKPILIEPILIEPILMEPILMEPILMEPILMEPILMEPILIEPILMEPILIEPILMEPYLIKYSYNHFKGSKKAFNYNPYNGINIVSFGRVDMLERFKSTINKTFRLNICKNKLILKIIIIKIIVLISDNRIIIPDKFTKD